MFVDEDLSGIAIQALACSSWMFIKNHLMMSMYAYLIQLYPKHLITTTLNTGFSLDGHPLRAKREMLRKQ